jgi:glycosyltransferase involved in cell wall biosynthesis
MKVVILHPPLYPVNHQFFNLLGQKVDLTVYSFGEFPGLHNNWSVHDFISKDNTYKLNIIKGNTDLSKGAVSYKTQMNPLFLKKLIQDKPDVVISVAFWMPSLYVSILKNILGYKFLIITDAISETEKNISTFRKTIRKIICQNTDSFISASDLTSEYLHSLCPHIPIKYSLQTIDVTVWNNEINQLKEKDFLRDEIHLSKDKTILLGVGGFTMKKNWESVFRQMKDINESQFVLIGAGELERKYKEYIKTNNLQEKIIIVSRKEGMELKKYFKASDIFIFPSSCDQFGYVVPEALCSGLPVICSKYAGASSLIENGVNGFVVDSKNNFTREIDLTIKNLVEMRNNAFVTMQNKTLENKANEFFHILMDIKEKK